MFVTVALCTWNRADLLRQTLEGMTRLNIPGGVQWELLVVNNNSTDDTEAVSRRFASALPIRVLVESEQGKAHALNLAVREARGDFIIWTDDDVQVDDGWVMEYVSAFTRWPQVAFFGGPIEPWFPVEPPSWLNRAWNRLGVIYGARDLGTESVTILTEAMSPYGANMAVRADVQRRFPYDSRFGPKAGARRFVGGVETKLVRDMLAQGQYGKWVPGAKVRHYVEPERMTLKNVRRYWTGAGRYQVYSGAYTVVQGPKLFGRPRWLWRMALMLEARYRMNRVVAPPEQWMGDLILACETWGRLSALRSKHS